MSHVSPTSTSPVSRWVLASNNVGKLREFSALFAPLNIQILAQSELGISEAQEPHPSFIENAITKARHASLHSALPALADDSGLCVRSLALQPGVHSARFAQMAGRPKSDQANNQLLIERLQGIVDRRAFYVCALAFVRHKDDPMPMTVVSTWHGEIVDTPLGEAGFGYDPHFYLPDQGLTAAQLNPAVKNKISHRGQALQQLLAVLHRQGDRSTSV